MQKRLRYGLWTIALCASPCLFAQKTPKTNPPAPLTNKRPNEKAVLLEKEFIEAMQQKMLGNTEEAINKFLDVLQKDNNNAVANYELALLYQKQKHNDKALVRAERAVELDKTNPYFVKLYSQLLEQQNEFAKAASLFEGLCKANPDKEYYYYEWAYFLVRANKKEQAIKVYNNLEKRVGIQAEISLRKHKLYWMLQKEKKAIEELERLVKAQPQEADNWLQLASFYTSIKKEDKAQANYRKVLELDPSNAEANIAMAEVFRKDRDTLRYLTALGSIFENPNQNPESKYKVLQAILQQYEQYGSKPEHRRLLVDMAQKYTQTHPDYAKSHLLAGNLSFLQGQYAPAKGFYETALALDKNNLEAWYYLLQSESELKDLEGLLKHSQQTMDVFPDQAIGYYFNGLGQWLKGDARAALKVLEPSLIMASANPRLQVQMYKLVGLAHAQLGQYEKSDKAFDNALSMQPNDAEILSEYSRCLVLRTEKTNQALQMGKQANEIAPNVPLYQSNYAYVFYKLQRYGEAKDWLNKAIDNGGSNDPLILERLGDVYFRLGDVDKAMEQWQRAVNLGSFSTVLRKKIETKKLYE